MTDMIWEQIKDLAENKDGFVRTAHVETTGISKSMLKKYTIYVHVNYFCIKEPQLHNLLDFVTMVFYSTKFSKK